MIVWSINLLILTAIILIVGMIKPNWILFWMDQPQRMPIIWIVAILFMVSVTLFGQGNKELQAQSTQKQPLVSQKIDKTEPIIKDIR